MTRPHRFALFGFALALLSAGVLLAPEAHAQAVDLADFARQAGFSTQDSLPLIIARLIRTVIGFMGILVVLYVLYGGFLYLTSAGEEEQIRRAKRTITNAVIGVVIVLSSFAIAQFIVGVIANATGSTGGITGQGPGGGSGGSFDTGSSRGQFVLTDSNQACSGVIQNIQPQLVFSQAVSETSVQNGGISVSVNGQPVDGSFDVSGTVVTFIPDAVCDSVATERCLPPNATVDVLLNQAILRSASGRSVSCAAPFSCAVSLQTGTGIDRTGPSVTLQAPSAGASVLVGEIVPLQARVTDDVGGALVSFTAGSDAVFSAGLENSTAGVAATENFFSTDDTAWDTAGLVSGRSVSLLARAVDCAGHAVNSPRVSVNLRAASCVNGVQDTDVGETGVDCGGSGEFSCGACEGQRCTDSSECSTGVCSAGRCVSTVRIDSVSATDGAPGNFVTIAGSGFGTTPGTVTFLGAEQGDGLAAAAVSCNGTSQWSDSQIVVAVPSGAVDGPIQVVGADGTTDRTDDSFGSVIRDFDVNTTVRPGLCAAAPTEGVRGAQVSLSANNLGDDQSVSSVYFDSTEAASYFSWTNTSASIAVPALDARTYRLQAFVGQNTCSVSGIACAVDADCGGTGGVCTQNRQGSNRISFRVQSTGLDAAPSITFVDSGRLSCDGGSNAGATCTADTDCSGGSCTEDGSSGPVGQAVTLVGSGFGTRVGTVRLVNAAGGALEGVEAVADVEFPAACGDGLWRDDTAVILVPTRYTNGELLQPGLHQLRLVRSEDGVASNIVSFTVVVGQPGPLLCALDPASGPVSTLVDAVGQSFGTSRGSVIFTQNQSVSPVVWSTSSVSDVPVPADAQTGPVFIRTASGATSNSIPFAIVDCRETSDACAEGTACCADGSCRASCDLQTGVQSQYAWRFSTSPIPLTPQVLVQCSADFLSPSPWEGFSDAVCTTAVMTATFGVSGVPVVMDASTLNADTIVVEECDTPASCRDIVGAVSGTVDAPANGSSFVFTPSVPLKTGTRYRVTVRGGATAGTVRSAAGEPMEEDYEWEFVTGTDSTTCSIGSVAVAPSSQTITEVGGTAGFISIPRAAADRCVAMACQASQGWTWSISGSEATLVPSATNACAATATAVRETAAPLTISASVAEAGVPDGTALLSVDLVDPKVISVVPSCGDACINAQLVATFNTAMDRQSIEQDGNITLMSCEDALCLDGLVPVAVSVAYNDLAREAVITPVSDLNANTNYRVILSGDIRSASAVVLSKAGGNFRLSGTTGALDYSWTFKTRTSAERCRVARVDVSPRSATVKVIGARQEYTAKPTTAPDTCSANGQRLVADDITWSAWTIADAADDEPTVSAAALLNSPNASGGILRTSALGASCSTSCLLTGNALKAGVAMCGNGVKETGEDCDDGNTGNGDGCSAVCLNEGTDAPQCGNGSVALVGEDCDDGNTVDGDGCSSRCLNEGAGSLLCGNGTRDFATFAGGEDCDRALDPIGCSARCTNLGTPAFTNAVCGNGVVNAAAGEACDDGNNTNGDGCSSACLFEGNPLTTCGNGVVNAAAGEACDDGNNTNGDGCSSVCLFEGSSATYADPSFCGDTVVGAGEACEAPLNASIAVGPYSVAQALEGASQEIESGTKIARSIVTATAEGTSGSAEFGVECSCQSDAACGSGGALGCGYSGCCSARPTVIGALPVGTNTCRNPEIRVDFSEKMDLSSVSTTTNGDTDRRIYLEATSIDGAAVTAANCPHELIAQAGASEGWFARLRNAISGLFGRSARAQSLGSCVVATTYHQVPGASGSSVYLDLSTALAPNTTYRLVVEHDTNTIDGIREGVLSALGVGLSAPFTQAFTTGADVCSLDGVSVIDLGRVNRSEVVPASSEFFSQTNETHDLRASGFALRNSLRQAIQPIVGVYAWAYSWASAPAPGTEDVISLGAPSTDGGDSVITATAVGQNGEDVQVATATVTTDNANPTSTVGRAIDGSVTLNALLCENPWPSIQDGVPFVEDGTVGPNPTGATNFSFFYCRDAGQPGTADDLPAMADPVRVSGSPTGDLQAEFLFTIPSTGDALGVKVIKNPEYLPADLWYKAKQFGGSISEASLDGYEAVRDGDTLYVLAANQTGDIFPNIYVVSMNTNASPIADTVFAQILANWRFNANTDAVSNVNLCRAADGTFAKDEEGAFIGCSADAQCGAGNTCDAEKAKLIRDTKRLSDTARMQVLLDTFGSRHGYCALTTSQSCVVDSQCPVTTSGSFESCEPGVPLLAEGTFIRTMSTSAWPSWTGVLTQDIGSRLPVDPLNTFASCASVDADPATCFNSSTGAFQCNAGSYVYGFNSFGGQNYTMTVQLEHGEAPWGFPIDNGAHANATVRAEYTNYTGPATGTITPELSAAFSATQTIHATRIANHLRFISSSCPAAGEFRTELEAAMTQLSSSIASIPTTGKDAAIVAFTIYRAAAERQRATALARDPACLGSVQTSRYDSLILSLPALETALNNVTVDARLPAGFFTTSAFCSGVTVGDSAICGDGVRGAGEVCEVGETQAVACGGGLKNVSCINDSGTCRFQNADESDAACVAFQCGNAVIDPGETCDDGALNGTFGHCGPDCSAVGSLFCGDGFLAGSEQCDCGSVDVAASPANGSWAALNCISNGSNGVMANGVYATPVAGKVSCNFDCTVPGPTCGDGLINGPEQCDGGSESYAGAFCSNDVTKRCTTSADCGGAACGGTAATNACPTAARICTEGDPNRIGRICSADSDCGANGACSSQQFATTRTRTCNAPGTSQQCTFSTFSACQGGAQRCGNGVKEGTELCDDGNTNNNDACTNTCQLAVCGDGFVNRATESCDAGAQNGISPTVIPYNGTATFCTSDCRFRTVSGPFCGDNVKNGPEFCDATDFGIEGGGTPKFCVNTDTNTVSGSRTCTADADCGEGSTCERVGICTGGPTPGDVCELGVSNACGDGGRCVAPVCSPTCGSSCPFAFETTDLLVQSELQGAQKSKSVSLFSFLNEEGNVPDNASLFIPACAIGSGFTADIARPNVTPPSVDILFMVDTSGSMNNRVSGQRRIDIVADAMNPMIDNLLNTYGDLGGTMRIGIGSFEQSTAHQPFARIDQSFTSSASSLHSIVNGYRSIDGAGGTPTQLGLELARDTFASSSTANRKILILLSDGEPDPVTIPASCDDAGDPSVRGRSIAKMGAVSVVRVSTTTSGVEPDCSFGQFNASNVSGQKRSGFADVEIYTAAITTNSELKSFMQHISDDSCSSSDYFGPLTGNVAYASAANCGPNTETRRKYAYDGGTAEQIQGMFDAILDSVLGVTSSFVTSSGSGAQVSSSSLPIGNNVAVPLPKFFTCQATQQVLPLSVTFDGEGQFDLSNFSFDYCPIR